MTEIVPAPVPAPVPSLQLEVAPLPPDRHPAAIYLARLAPGSRRAMRSALDVLAALARPGAHAETLPWQLLRYAHVAALRARLAARYAPATANRVLAALRGVLREAWRLGLISAEDYHRARAVEGVRGSRLPPGRALDASELRALAAACSAAPSGVRNLALLALLYGAGLRRSEVVALDLAHLDAVGALRVRGKGDKEREVPLPASAERAVRAWVHLRGDAPGPLLLPVSQAGVLGHRRLSDAAVLKILRRIAHRAGVRVFSPHDLRRTYISELLDRGADIATVQQLAGHAQVTTTARYDRRGVVAKRRAVELLDVPERS